MKSKEYLNSFGLAKGISRLEFDENGFVFFETEQTLLPISIETDINGENIHACILLKNLINQDTEYQVLVASLLVNGALNPQNRGIVTLEGDHADKLIFMKFFQLKNTTQDEFNQQMEQFILDAEDLSSRFDDENLNIPPDDDEKNLSYEHLEMNMLKI